MIAFIHRADFLTTVALALGMALLTAIRLWRRRSLGRGLFFAGCCGVTLAVVLQTYMYRSLAGSREAILQSGLPDDMVRLGWISAAAWLIGLAVATTGFGLMAFKEHD